MSGTKIALGEVADLAKTYARERGALQDVVDDIHDDQRAILRARKRSLQAAVVRASAAKDALRTAIDGSRALFERPRTQTCDGVKFGLRKLPGRIDLGDEAQVITRIRRKLPNRADDLVRVRESLAKPALRNLDARSLAAIGVQIDDVADEIIIAAASDDLDKLVAALLPDEEV